MNRRQFLGLGTVSAASMLAGCALMRSSSGDEEGSSVPDNESWPMVAGDSSNTGQRDNTGVDTTPGTEWTRSDIGKVSSGVVVRDGSVFANTESGEILALNEDNGETAWRKTIDSNGNATPAVGENMVYFGGTGNDALVAVDPDSGDIKWRLQLDADQRVTESPKIGANTVFVPVINSEQETATIYALAPETGDRIWEYESEGILSTPAVNEGKMYVGTSLGELFVLNSRGQKRWSFNAETNLTCPPTISEEDVFIGGLDKKVYTLAKNSGDQRWTATMPRMIRASPAVNETAIFVLDMGGTLKRFHRQTGEKEWTYNSSPIITSRSISLAKGVIYVPTDRGVIAVDATDGTELWRWEGHNSNQSPPAVANGTVYIGHIQGGLSALS